MHEVLERACEALQNNDADLLERLVLEAHAARGNADTDRAALLRSAAVLAAQVQAASTHLRLRGHGGFAGYGSAAWAR